MSSAIHLASSNSKTKLYILKFNICKVFVEPNFANSFQRIEKKNCSFLTLRTKIDL